MRTPPSYPSHLVMNPTSLANPSVYQRVPNHVRSNIFDTVYIIWLATDMCMTAASDDVSAKVVIESCGSNPQLQDWTFTSSGQVRIGDNCLDVPWGLDLNTIKLRIYPCSDGNPSQQWLYSVRPSPHLQIAATDIWWHKYGDQTLRWVNKGKCLDLTSGDLASGTPVRRSAVLYACSKVDLSYFSFKSWIARRRISISIGISTKRLFWAARIVLN